MEAARVRRGVLLGPAAEAAGGVIGASEADEHTSRTEKKEAGGSVAIHTAETWAVRKAVARK
jgi:hypothetical protein